MRRQKQTNDFQEPVWLYHKALSTAKMGFQQAVWAVHKPLPRKEQFNERIWKTRKTHSPIMKPVKPMFFSGRFAGKVLIVTGAGQGIGKSVAMRAAQEGGAVVLVDRSPIVENVVNELRSNGFNVLAVLADLETYEGFHRVCQQANAAFGRIDVLINNVGGTIWAKPFTEYTEEQIIKEINRSLYPTLWGCRAVLPYFLAQGGGCIVNISSIATRGINRVPYSAAKGGVNALTASLAFEYGQQNIRVNAIATGGTEAPPRVVPRNSTPLSEKETIWYQQIIDQTIDSSLMKRYGTIDEQVSAILYLASDEASYITGVVMPVGGGDLG